MADIEEINRLVAEELNRRDAEREAANKPRELSPREQVAEYIEQYAAQASQSPAHEALSNALRGLLHLIDGE